MPCKHLLSSVILLFITSGCVSYGVSEREIDRIEAGELGGITSAYEEFYGFYGAYLTFMNLDTNEFYTVDMKTSPGALGPEVGMKAVTPGTFRIVDGKMYHSAGRADMPMLSTWFGEFSVEAGEIVDLGTINMSSIQVKSLPNKVDQLINKMKQGHVNNVTTYVTYEFDSKKNDKLIARLAKKDVQIEPRTVRLEPVLDADEMQRVIDEAFASVNTGDELPSPRVVNETVDAAVKKYVTSKVLSRRGSAD